MGNVARVGDPLKCGDFIALGSSNVFANGMPVVAGESKTTGHTAGTCFWPPTIFVSQWAETVFVNSKPVVLLNKTLIQKHCCGRSCHDSTVAKAASTVGVELE